MDNLATQDPIEQEATEQPDLRSVLEQAVEAAPEEVKEQAQRARDEAGRFAKSQQETPKVEEPKEATAEKIEPRKPPSSWKKEAQVLWDKAAKGENLTPQEFAIVQAEAERRESEFHKGIEGYKTKAQFGDAMEKAVLPYMATINALGVDPPTAVQHLLTADHKLRTSDPMSKAQFMAKLIQDYQVDPQALYNIFTGQMQSAPPPEIQSLEQKIAALEQERQRERQMADLRERETLNSEIERFAQDKPHFQSVVNEMLALLPRVVESEPHLSNADKLQKAYDMAVYANPEVRAAILEQERQDALKKAQDQTLAQRAKSAAVSVRGSSPASGGKSSPSNLRQALSEAIDQYS